MRLFKRKPEIDDVPRCPNCRERVPEGATQCAMCGLGLTHLADARDRERYGVPSR